jgi:hypothetical protein
VGVYSLWENKERAAIQIEYWMASTYGVKAILGIGTTDYHDPNDNN